MGVIGKTINGLILVIGVEKNVVLVMDTVVTNAEGKQKKRDILKGQIAQVVTILMMMTTIALGC